MATSTNQSSKLNQAFLIALRLHCVVALVVMETMSGDDDEGGGGDGCDGGGGAGRR